MDGFVNSFPVAVLCLLVISLSTHAAPPGVVSRYTRRSSATSLNSSDYAVSSILPSFGPVQDDYRHKDTESSGNDAYSSRSRSEGKPRAFRPSPENTSYTYTQTLNNRQPIIPNTSYTYTQTLNNRQPVIPNTSGRQEPKEIHDNHFMSSFTTPPHSNQQQGENVEISTQFSATNLTLPQTTVEERRSSYDDYKVELSPDQMTHFPIDISTCYQIRGDLYANDAKGREIKHEASQINGTSGIVYLINNKGMLVNVTIFCSWNITVPEYHFIAARYEVLLNSANQIFRSKAVDSKDSKKEQDGFYKMLYSSSNKMTFEILKYPPVTNMVNVTAFYLYFTTVTHDGKRILPVNMTSATTGFVTSMGFGSKAGYSTFTNASYDLIVPPDHVIMTRFRSVDLEFNTDSLNYVTLYELHNKTRRVHVRTYGINVEWPRLSQHSLRIEMISDFTHFPHVGFKLDYSFHPSSDAPVMFTNGTFDCARPNYQSFRQHVHCDLIIHCAGGEDESANCSFSSQFCRGVVLRTKCYTLDSTDMSLSWYEANDNCRMRGGNLAVVRSSEEWIAVKNVFRYVGMWQPAYVGLLKVTPALPKIYWSLWQWSDFVMAYSAKILYVSQSNQDNMCAYYDPNFGHFHTKYDTYLFSIACSDKFYTNYICESKVRNSKMTKQKITLEVPDLAHKVDTLWSGYKMTECPFSHVTFTFQSCELSSNCGLHQYQDFCTTHHTITSDAADQSRSHGKELSEGSSEHDGKACVSDLSDISLTEQGVSARRVVAVTVAMFACDARPTTVHYTFVCDHVAHCPGSSDETFCKHDKSIKCNELTCNTGQCYLHAQRCDRANDCFDASDEASCMTFSDHSKWRGRTVYHPPPSLIEFYGQGNFSQRPMDESEPCPETHFQCPGGKSHCLPIYLRCNGFFDCPEHEDELACDSYACPGFYRCRDSKVCVHVDHMCDGSFQCTQRDDEIYCGLSCPRCCSCEGFAIVCSVKFRAHKYPQTRYLDATGSNVKPEDLFHNTYLVWIRLASCGIETVTNTSWPNIKYMDLSQNDIHYLSMDNFLNATNLLVIIIADNPLSVLAKGSECFALGNLKILDLSNTNLRQFDSDVLSCYPRITGLNFSNSRLDQITDNGFNSTLYLTDVDLSGSPVSRFPRDIFKRLNHLKLVRAENYKLCCKATLPMNFNEHFCLTTYDEISSCEDLLKSDFLRGCMWIFAALSVCGNFFCFAFKVFSEHKSRRSGFSVFVINLTIADFLMGVYLVIVGVADEVYRGQYMWNDTAWQTSSACTTAGFLALLSSEMSACTICLITLDRFIVLTFPFSSVRFEGWSATLTCGLVWTTGLVLASAPFFPQTSEWEFYGQTGICIPLPTTRKKFPGHEYAFGVMIILNFLLCLLIAVGQASIYRSVKANSMTCDSSKKSKDLVVARRLIAVAASDFLCWFPIGLLGILSSNGVPVSSNVNVAMAVFVLPLNSSLNPFLYTFNVVMERRRNVREAQLSKLLEARIRAEQVRQQTVCRCCRQKHVQS